MSDLGPLDILAVVPKVLFTLFDVSDKEGVTIQALPYFASTREMIQEAPEKVRKYGINSQIQAYVYL